jgi:hypothetical protein
LYGDLRINGDAASAPPGQPGNWIWRVSGDEIVKIVLEFGEGFDPNISFDHLSFTRTCGYQTLYSVDFSAIPPGQSVEGMGAAARYLDIKAKGQAVRVVQATEPIAFVAPNDTTDTNGGLTADGGFGDLLSRQAGEPYQYTFTFAQGILVTDFSLHMLDYGDYNPTLDISHHASLTAYDANDNVVDQQVLSYTTPAKINPRSSSLYGDLRINGDAVSAALGQPGNWTWRVSGDEIVKIVLEFGEGFDPNIAFDQLYFTIVRQE